MARALGRRLRVGCAFVAGLVLGGCATSVPRVPAGAVPVPAVPAVPSAAAAAPMTAKLPQPDSDWRTLPAAPFGSRVQDLPFAVHEVLLFRDREDSADAAGAAERECYVPDGPARRFVGREAQTYLLCFARGRLARFEVTLALPAHDAAAEFSSDCDIWQSGTVIIKPRTAQRCDGVQPPGLAFIALLGESADDVTTPLTVTVFEILPPDSP